MFNFFWSYQQPLDNVYTTIKLGYLYNWYAASDSRMAASGWHVMTITELNSLITYLGGSTIAGQHLKEADINYWNAITYNDNTSGFNLRGAGYRSSSGTFTGTINKIYGVFWTATLLGGTFAYSATTTHLDAAISNYNNPSGIANIKTGQPIRLVKDSGTATSYTGNDGKVYRTVEINGVTFTADNLAETLWNDASSISEVTGGTAWGSLTTAARCVQDNNESNM